MENTAPTKKYRVMVATPCYGGTVFTNYFTSMLQLFRSPRADVEFELRTRSGDSLVTRARNSLVAEFIANEHFTHLMWVDADIGFAPSALYRLLDSGHDIAAGIYPLKGFSLPEELNGNRDELFMKHQRYPFNPIDRKNLSWKNGFAEVKDAPTGMMCIKREVFIKMIEAYPELKYMPDRQLGIDELHKKIGECYYNFFDTFIDDTGRYLSEDYAFCRLWQNIGGKVHADINSKLSHQGAHRYQGDLFETIKQTYNVTAA